MESTAGNKRKIEEEEEKEETTEKDAADSDSEEEEEYSDYYEDENDEPEQRPQPYATCIHYDSSDPEDYKTDEYKKYVQAIAHSRGYDLPERPNLKISDNLVPTYNFKVLGELSVKAIEDYNQRNKTEYVFHSVEKGNRKPARGILYYITFKATGPDGIIQDFQAKVLYGVPDITVDECHPKPNPNPNPPPSADE